MTLKIVSTLILSGHSEECKCEIYQQDTAEGPKFNACLYVRREVLMVLKAAPVSVSRFDAPTSKPVLTWVQARILNDINVTSLEDAEATIKHRFIHEAFLIPGFEVQPYENVR